MTTVYIQVVVLPRVDEDGAVEKALNDWHGKRIVQQLHLVKEKYMLIRQVQTCHIGFRGKSVRSGQHNSQEFLETLSSLLMGDPFSSLI